MKKSRADSQKMYREQKQEFDPSFLKQKCLQIKNFFLVIPAIYLFNSPLQYYFNVRTKYLVDVTERQKEVFAAAAARWERTTMRGKIISGTEAQALLSRLSVGIISPGMLLRKVRAF